MSIASFTVGCCLNSPLQFTSAGSSHYQLCLTPRKGFTDHPPSWLESGLCSLVFQHHSYLHFNYSHGDLMGGEFTMLTITASSWIKALEYHLMLFDMINNKWHFFFFLFHQNPWLGSWTKPGTGRNSSLMATLFKFSIFFWPPSLAPVPLDSLTLVKSTKGVREHDDKLKSWTVPRQGSRKWKLLAKQSMLLAEISSIRSPPQDVAPGCGKGPCCTPVSPQQWVCHQGWEEKVGMKWQWALGQASPCRPAGSSQPLRGPVPPGLFDQGPSWHREMLFTWLVRTVAALSGVLGKHAVS